MKRLRAPISILTLIAMVMLFVGVVPVGDAVGQQKTLKEQLVGTWIYVSVDTVSADGNRTPMYGANPQGLAMFDGNGRYILLTERPGLPKFASNSRLDGTQEENKAIVQGSIAHFGRYTVNEVDKTITFRIETSTFPNWNGTVQTRPFTINGNELKWTTPGASGGGTGEVILKRAE